MKIPRLFDFGSKHPELNIPADRINRLGHSYQRRLGDALEDVFHRACVEGDARTAAGLFAVLEDLHTRRAQEKASERRITDDVLTKARVALDRCRMVAGQDGRSKRLPPAELRDI